MCNNRFFPGSNDYTSSHATSYYCLIYALCITEDINLTQFFICVLEGDSKSTIDIIGLRVPTKKLRDFPSLQVCPFCKFLQATCVSLRATTRTDGPLLSCLQLARTGVVQSNSLSDRKAVSTSDEHSNVSLRSVSSVAALYGRNHRWTSCITYATPDSSSAGVYQLILVSSLELADFRSPWLLTPIKRRVPGTASPSGTGGTLRHSV